MVVIHNVTVANNAANGTASEGGGMKVAGIVVASDDLYQAFSSRI